MNSTKVRLRRLILGMSVEDAQSKFDSPESCSVVRIAHERHNLGVLHELHVAQRARNRLSPERKCHICRYTKPSVRGFQGYTKRFPEDYTVVELWGDDPPDAPSPPPAREAALIDSRIANEKALFTSHRSLVLSALSSASDVLKEIALAELTERRKSGSLVASQPASVVDRLVGTVTEATEKGYKRLSSSTHLLEPIVMSLSLCSKKEKEVGEAFQSALLGLPAQDGDISYSLWVSGALIADDTLTSEFPYHVAKYVVNDTAESTPHRLPKAEVQLYFSPELYQLNRAIGKAGIAMLRSFIGHAMKQQHGPTPLSPSMILNSTLDEQQTYNLRCSGGAEGVRIPWIHRTTSKVSTITGIALHVNDSDEKATTEQKKEAISLVWKIWGHLIKDLHVYGDPDCLHVSIDRDKEVRENEESIVEVRQLEEESTSELMTSIEHSVAPSDAGGRKRTRPKKQYIPIAADFTVVECLLERKGLAHNMVVEDIVESLVTMQKQASDMVRLSAVEEIGTVSALKQAIPVLYAPKIVVSHAGVIENRSHSFQRIRIRGSSLAHIQALASDLTSGGHFTKRVESLTDCPQLPPNLSFHSSGSGHNNRTLGHNIGMPTRSHGGKIQRNQTTQVLDHMVVSDEERAFWRDHYYSLSAVKLIFHDRVEPPDALNYKLVSPRLHDHLQMIGKLSADEEDDLSTEGEAAKQPKGKPRRRKRTKKVDLHSIKPEKMFEYLCTDKEAACALYDLTLGECSGYEYQVRVGHIPSGDVERVLPACNSLAAKGFINYFGATRFASYTKMNIHPGMHLLKGQFRAAAHVIVQQFYVDAAMHAEKCRTGAAFPKLGHLNGSGYHLSDFSRGNQSVSTRGTALQKVLSNAIQASMMISGGEDGMQWDASRADSLDDPCADAFRNVVGPKACRIIVNEFLSFVWNDLVNQRLLRYGTFAVLPGDLVRKHPDAPRHSVAYQELRYVSKADIQQGKYGSWDVVLPIPGANVQLPDNYTSDLYVVTLNRWGLHFNPESRQWDCFYPRVESNSSAILSSPYRALSDSFALHEEELGCQTQFSSDSTFERSATARQNNNSTALTVTGEGGEWDVRPDLAKQHGNLLNLRFDASYRAPLMRPGPSFQWQLNRGAVSDPYQRWSQSILHRAAPLTSSSSTSTDSISLLQRSTGECESLAVGSSFARNHLHYRPTSSSQRRRRTLPIPPKPHWLATNCESTLMLRFAFPPGVYPSMLLRELTKMDVNSPDVVDIDKPLVDLKPSSSFQDLRPDQQELYHRHLTKRRKARFVHDRPRALSLALLHQQIFRSGGVRHSLIPTLRSYDSVSK